jgi:phospholipid transport system transporter-binding protein
VSTARPINHGGLSAARHAPAIDGEAAFVAVGDGVYRLEASLTFATVPLLRNAGMARIAGAAGPIEFDLQGVAVVDSAGLALLIDWLADARAQQRTLRYGQLPEVLRALARLSDVESLLTPGPAAAVSAAPAAGRSP